MLNIKNLNVSLYDVFKFFDGCIINFHSLKLNSEWTIVAWHRPIVDVINRVDDQNKCLIVEMSNDNITTAKGEGFALYRHNKVEYEFRPGDISHENVLIFKNKED